MSGVAVLAVCVVMAATGCALIFASIYRSRHGVLRSQRLEWALKPRPVPGWMYLIVAGIAILAGILDVLATRLAALMLLIFSALVLAPLIFAFPRDHVAWGSNAYNLAAVGAAWIVADWLAASRQPVQNQ